MARDYAIRFDLKQLGLPERSIRVLEKAARLVETFDRLAAAETAQAATDTAIDAIQEDQEDQNLSLSSLDTRVDAIEDFSVTDPRYVKKAGDAMTGALDVQSSLQCDSLRIDAAPAAAAAVASTHKLAISCNGTTYYVLLSNV